MKRPTPAALQYLALVGYIHPKGYREKVGLEAFAKAPVGSGPYRISKVEPGKLVEFERFEGYWDKSPKGRPAIKKITARMVPDAATEMTELLSGRTDWIWNINPDQFENVGKVPTLQSARKESMRIGFLSLDAAGRSGAGNPLTNLKVRQAIWHAIDRQALADKLVTGGSRVPPGPCYPDPVRLRRRVGGQVRLQSGEGQEVTRRGGFPEWLRHRAGDIRAADLGGGGAELSAGRRHPRAHQSDPGGSLHPALLEGREPDQPG